LSVATPVQPAPRPASTSASRAGLVPGVAPLLLRIALGTVFIAHGAQKLFGAFGGGGISGTSQFFESLGATPGTFFAVLAGVIEFFGGLAVLLGALTRAAALALALDMAGAIVLATGAHGFFEQSGGWEYDFALIAMSLALVAWGAGTLSADAPARRWVAARRPKLAQFI
jgi:putative oxidoreductase